ncbi:MAG: SLC13 family permease [Chitinophagales bacterium]|nr:SLC13/DASS family transporter [Bacteroidota bacterium]MCB9044288.1 SLC13/DASS family transporter [Chitinophagales bacterium]
MSAGKRYLKISKDIPWRKFFFVLAPFISLYIILFLELDAEKPTVTYTLAVAVWMALWWLTEIVPLAITSLLPIVLFPILGIMDGKNVSATYFNDVIFIFIGGFIVALAIQKWNLHKRIALIILRLVGVSKGKILFGFMFASAFLSMWISNTATAMMMVPILLSVITKLEWINGKKNIRHFSVGMLLAIAYGCSVGGIATLIGTPPNLAFSRIFAMSFANAPEISFAEWFIFAFPLAVFIFIVVYTYLYFVFIKKGPSWQNITASDLDKEYKELGKPSYEEKSVLIAFIILVLLWFLRADINFGFINVKGWSNLFAKPNYINDGTVAILVAIALFVIPTKQEQGKYLMDWKAAEDIPWEIILLFGGGFALAAGFKESGLSQWIGEQLSWIGSLHPIIVILVIALMVTFITELTSNMATVSTFLPILVGLSLSVNINPLLFMIPATIAGSMAFMLPVATPPNAIVFSTNRIKIYEMAKTGFVLNLITAIIIAIVVYFWGAATFGIDMNAMPNWAK